ncbi:hypothetical protein WJX81_004036 [Elliptochloris bilobata]|uniref:GDT1 family protein n=1 Tax=Elliptochloris bilobata TaxID=381761 RepID=A0AAW1QY34_9CHLO
MWLEDVFVGALAPGVNAPTVLLLNAALVGCIASLGTLLVLALQGAPALVPHVAFLLALAAGLLLLINWFLGQVGTVDARKQRQHLFGSQASNATPLAAAAAARQPDGSKAD